MEQPEWKPGDLVWAKMRGFPWWPAMTFPSWAMVEEWELDIGMPKKPKVGESQQVVYFFETQNFLVLDNKSSTLLGWVDDRFRKYYSEAAASLFGALTGCAFLLHLLAGSMTIFRQRASRM